MSDGAIDRRAAYALGMLLLALTECGTATFTCDDATDCRDGDRIGACQPEGVCSFADDACSSGQRFAEHAGPLSRRCVELGDSSSTALSVADDTLADGAASTLGESTLGESTQAGSSGPVRDTGDAEGNVDADASSSGDDGDPSLLLWFTFDDDLVDGLDNAGALGGVAACMGEGCPTAAPGVLGGAATFDGIDDCGVYAFVPALAPPQFTLSLWARREVAVPGFDSLFAKPVGDMPYNTWRLTMWSSEREGERINVHVGMIDDTGADSFAPLPFGTWVHFAGTWSGNELVSYVDGQRFETITSTLIEVDDQPVLVGCDDDQVPEEPLVNFAHATLDDVRMYDRVLDDAEIAELHALGVP